MRLECLLCGASGLSDKNVTRLKDHLLTRKCKFLKTQAAKESLDPDMIKALGTIKFASQPRLFRVQSQTDEAGQSSQTDA